MEADLSTSSILERSNLTNGFSIDCGLVGINCAAVANCKKEEQPGSLRHPLWRSHILDAVGALSLL